MCDIGQNIVNLSFAIYWNIIYLTRNVIYLSKRSYIINNIMFSRADSDCCIDIITYTIDTSYYIFDTKNYRLAHIVKITKKDADEHIIFFT